VRSKSQRGGNKGRAFVDVARRSQLVDCAIEAIAELGFQRASLAEIGRRAGLTKAAIFYHFASRDELILEIVGTVLRRGAEFMAARSQGLASPADELRAYIESNVEYVSSHRDDVKVLVAITVNFRDDEGKSLFPLDASVYQIALAPLRDILGRGQQRGQFGEFNTGTMAMTIRSSIDAIGPQLSVIPDLDLVAYANDLVQLFRQATRK
jgi:AcrR family transcriptional regulator